MSDVELLYKKLKEEFETLINREKELTDRCQKIRELREKIKQKQIIVAQLEKELTQL